MAAEEDEPETEEEDDDEEGEKNGEEEGEDKTAAGDDASVQQRSAWSGSRDFISGSGEAAVVVMVVVVGLPAWDCEQAFRGGWTGSEE